MFQAADGKLWVSSEGGLSASLSEVGQGGLRFRSYTKAHGLSELGINCMAEDRAGNLWIGTESSGAMKIASTGFTTYGEADGLSALRIASLLINQAGELCATSVLNTAFINRFDGQRFEAVELRLPAGVTGWDWGWYQRMFQDRTGAWWMQTSDGLVRYPPLARLSQLARARPEAIYTQREGLAEKYPFRIYEDSHGDVWISTFSFASDTLTRWERQSATFHRFTAQDGLPPNGVPTAFGEDAAGNLWIGFYHGGLARYLAGRLTMFTSADGLPAGFIRGIYLDHAHRLWVAAGEGGVARIDDPAAEHPRFIIYNTANGLSSNQATCITEDQWGHLYIGTGRGLDRLDPATGHIKHYTTADGLAGNFINVALRDQAGALWFGTLQGLSRLVPQPDRPASPPPIMISELRAGGELHPLSALGETSISGLVLGADQNQMRIGFFGLSFGPGETLRYQYQLEGAQLDWSAPTDQREVNLASLAPGAYRFLVRAVTADGVLSQSPATVAFRILPPVWRRWWFLSLLAALMASVVIAFDRYRVARLKELDAALTESHQLTAQLTARQAELHQAHQALALEYDVTRVLAEAATPTEAAPKILQAICESGGWEIGALWDVDREVNVLRCVDVWHQPTVNAAAFEAMTREQIFVPGVGLPGRVWQSGRAYWITDLARDPNFPRLVTAAKEGLQSAFGFPILIESEVIGVIEFFSLEARQPDAEQIKILSAIGSHIGQLIERKRAEEALRESEDRFRTLAETASDAIITIDEHSTIVFVNPAAETVFGHPIAEMVGEELTMLMPEYLRHLHRTGFGRYLDTGHRHLSWEAIELPGLHRDGREIPLEVSFGEFTKNGQRFFTGIARDITERKRAEEALQRSREERLIELERVRRRIATDLHDDIGSSLTQISILSEVIRQRVGDDHSPVIEPLEQIAGASRELVDSMSDIVWAINPNKDHLRDLTQRMRRFAADSFTARNIKFELRLPDAEADVKLGANLRREVFLIFKESVNNMVRHAGCTAADIELHFTADALRLKLHDNGRGFDLTRESDGHGLMSMRDRAKDMGAEFEMLSQPGHGTTITLKVPLDHPAHPAS